MGKKKVKILSILTIFICIISVATVVFGEELDPVSIVENKTFGGAGNGVDTLYKLGNTILGIIQYVAAGVAVIATLILAIKYMYSAPGEKAEVKSKLIPYVIGGVLIFGAVSLVRVVEIFVGDIVK